MKILLISLNSKYIHTNLSIRYLKNNSDYFNDIIIKEFTINNQIESITSEIIDEHPDILAFSCYIWNIEYIKQIAYIIKTAKQEIKIILGGPEVSFEMENIMKNNKYIDYIIYGEGERTFNDLIKYFNEINNLEDIKGIAYRKGNKVIINEKQNLINNLDTIKFPYDKKENFKNKIIYYETSRGCPFNCSFCMSSIDKKVRYFSLERVKKDLDFLLQTNAKQIKFVDRTFNSNSLRAIEIMDYIAQNNKNNIKIHFEITAEIINEKFLDFLSSLPINMFQFEIGVQSINKSTLKAINRNTHLDKLEKVCNNIRLKKNIHQHLDLIAGLPYEDYNSFKKSFNFVHKLNIEKIQLGFLKVLKGTNIFNDRELFKIKYMKKAPYEVIKTKYISYEEILKLKKIEELVDKYYNEMYFKESINYIIKNYFNEPFEFYESFSRFWDKNELFKISHRRKKLYKFLYEFIKCNKIITNDFINKLKYDFIFNNQNEELLDIFDKNTEERYRKLKHYIVKNNEYFNKIFGDIDEIKIKNTINLFRIVEIGSSVLLFKYKEKDNIYNRCKVFNINDIVEVYENE